MINKENLSNRLPDNGDQLICTKKMAKLLGVSTQWLEIGRVHGYGPPFLKLSNRMIRYRVSDVREWLDKRSHGSTSEYTGGCHE